MKRGRKADPPEAKVSRGTLQPCRDAERVAIAVSDELPQRPEWLTQGGEMVWLEDIGRVAQNRMAREIDSTLFGNYCNLQGAINEAWRTGEVPPISSLTEVRRLAELFGLAGGKSRTVKSDGGTGSANPFARNGRR